MTTVARLNPTKIQELVKCAQELDHVSVQNVEDCKNKLDEVSNVEAKGRLYDVMMDEALDCTTVALIKLADDSEYVLSMMHETYTTFTDPSESRCVSSILKVLENCEKLSKKIGGMHSWTVCTNFSTYIHVKIAKTMSRIMLTRNFGTNTGNSHRIHPSQNANHHFHPLYVQLQKYRTMDWNHSSDLKYSTCPCEKSIQNHLLKNTRVTVKYEDKSSDIWFTIRGAGPGMSWEEGKGIRLEKLGGGFWVFEIKNTPLAGSDPIPEFEYKVLLNDKLWETGPNHKIQHFSKQVIRPVFEKV